MKREAVQEERQRGAKLQPKIEDINPTNSVRDLTVERIIEAERISEERSGDNAIPYLRVGPNSMVPPEYKVCARKIIENGTLVTFFFIIISGCCFTFMSNGQQTIVSIN